MCLLRINLHNLCPNMIHVDALDFSEWHSEEVISFFWRSVYYESGIFTNDIKGTSSPLIQRTIIVCYLFTPLGVTHGRYTADRELYLVGGKLQKRHTTNTTKDPLFFSNHLFTRSFYWTLSSSPATFCRWGGRPNFTPGLWWRCVGQDDVDRSGRRSPYHISLRRRRWRGMYEPCSSMVSGDGGRVCRGVRCHNTTITAGRIPTAATCIKYTLIIFFSSTFICSNCQLIIKPHPSKWMTAFFICDGYVYNVVAVVSYALYFLIYIHHW